MGLNKLKIGAFVEPYNEACGIANLALDDVSGINRDKEFFEPSKQVGADTTKYTAYDEIMKQVENYKQYAE